MKPYLATAKGGYVLISEVVGVEPRLCNDNLWRPVALTLGGHAVELDFKAHDVEPVALACETVIRELYVAKTWGNH